MSQITNVSYFPYWIGFAQIASKYTERERSSQLTILFLFRQRTEILLLR